MRIRARPSTYVILTSIPLLFGEMTSTLLGEGWIEGVKCMQCIETL